MSRRPARGSHICRRPAAPHNCEPDAAEFQQVPAGHPGAGQWRLAWSVAAPWEGRLADLVPAFAAAATGGMRPSNPEARANVTGAATPSTPIHPTCMRGRTRLPTELMGGFRGATQISIDKCQSPDRVSAGQGLCRVGTAGFEPTTP
jgi:hypothetical protein